MNFKKFNVILVLSLIMTLFVISPVKANEDFTRYYAGRRVFEEKTPSYKFFVNIRTNSDLVPLPEGIKLEFEYYNEAENLVAVETYTTVDKNVTSYNIHTYIDAWTDQLKYVDVYSVDTKVTESISLGNSQSQLTAISVNYNAEGGTFQNGNSENMTTSYISGKLFQSDVYEEPTHDKYNFSHWSYLGSEWSANDIHKSEFNNNKVREFKAAWEIPVHFETYGGSTIPSIIVRGQNNYITEPEAPSKEGSVFLGWYAEEAMLTKWEFYLDKVEYERTLHARWEPIVNKVEFESNGGTPIGPIEVEYGKLISKPSDPIRAGYDFIGWYHDIDFKNSFNFEDDRVYSDITLYAKWNRQDVFYDVTFDKQLGTENNTIKVLENTPVSEPKQPQRDGYRFEGWYIDKKGKTPWDFNNSVTESMTLYAKWSVITHTVSFETNGGSNVKNSKVNDGQKVKEPNSPTKNGFVFSGWYSDKDLEVIWSFDNPTTEDMTLYAKWSPVEVFYTITFDYQYDNINHTEAVLENTTISKPSEPQRDGYTFEGWYVDQVGTTLWDNTKPVNQDLTVYAKWSPVEVFYTITFDYQYDNINHTEAVLENTTISKPSEPQRNGYTFEGWYVDQAGTTLWDNTNPVDQDLTVYARWKNIIPEDEEAKPETTDSEVPEKETPTITDKKENSTKELPLTGNTSLRVSLGIVSILVGFVVIFLERKIRNNLTKL
ncbi:MAG: InlB B-repeat-containing protein [Erysipelothrix sp.]